MIWVLFVFKFVSDGCLLQSLGGIEHAGAASPSTAADFARSTGDERCFYSRIVRQCCTLAVRDKESTRNKSSLRRAFCVACRTFLVTKAWLKLSTAQRTEITKLRIENKSFKAVSIGDARKRGKR